MSTRSLELLPGRFAVCRLAADAAVPAWAAAAAFSSVTRTHDELYGDPALVAQALADFKAVRDPLKFVTLIPDGQKAPKAIR